MPKVNYRSQFSYSFAGQRVSILAKISIAAAGVPTLVSGTGMGVSSVTRNGAGDYSLLLDQAFYSLLGVNVSILSGTSAPAAPSMNIRADSVAVAAAPLVRVQFRDISGAAADPASGEVLYLIIDLNRSSTGC